MNWHIIGSVLWGFALTPAFIGFGVAFVYIAVTFKLNHAAALAGVGLGFAALVMAGGIVSLFFIAR